MVRISWSDPEKFLAEVDKGEELPSMAGVSPLVKKWEQLLLFPNSAKPIIIIEAQERQPVEPNGSKKPL